MENKKRLSNIELLRIFAMLGVIILHYNNETIGGGLKYVIRGSSNYYLLLLFESMFICAVNLFVLISGYFSCQSRITTLWKPIILLLQVEVFSIAGYLITAITKNEFTFKGLLASSIPANYFVILYIMLYFLSPYLNIILERLDRKFVIILFLGFSVYPQFVDLFNQISGQVWNGLSTIGMYGSQWGYTIINFIMMYFFGGVIRKRQTTVEKYCNKALFAFLVLNTLLIFGWSVLNIKYRFERNIAWSYSNPLVVIEAITVFILFLRINIGSIKWINSLSKSSFTVYLVHGYLIPHIGIMWAVQLKPLLMILHIVISSVVIYLVCFLIFLIYDSIIKRVLKSFMKYELIVTQL